jgi:Family of unknown function (DUF5906)
VTNPFQSIIGTGQSPAVNPPQRLDEAGERNSFAEALAEDIRAEQLAAISVLRPETGETSEHPADIEHVETGLETLPPLRRKPLCGGIYNEQEALTVLNSHFFIGKSNQETAIFRINSDDTVTFLPPEQFKLEIQHIFVNVGTPKSAKLVPGDKFWKENPNRNQKWIVFKPSGATDPSEYNLWHGYGVEPRKGWQKQRRFLRHVLKIICRGDRSKFKYLIRWLAWAVQNPDKQAAVVIVLKSRKQGTGKSTLGVVMLRIFGQHGTLIDDSDRLLGQFNDWAEPISFILAEEILWAGDHKTADKLKSRVTADTFQIERKHGAVRQIPNRLHIIMTTNHDHAVGAGVGDRRFVVYDVSDECACDKSWFDPIYRDLDQGGASEFLRFLQDIKLGNWHPRQILKTAEATEQQRMSGDSVSQWSQACIIADAIIGAERGSYGAEVTHDLGAAISFEALYRAYRGFCKGQHTLTTEAFGKACADMFGPRKRLRALRSSTTGNGKRRPWGYRVPTGTKWQEKVDARLGIKR